MTKITLKMKLRDECNTLKIEFLIKDNNDMLKERILAHKEKRDVVPPKKKPNPFVGKSVGSGSASGSTQKSGGKGSKKKSGGKGFKHEDGKTYKFSSGRTHVILMGEKYSTKEALTNADVMNELIKRGHSGLTSV